MKIEKTDWMKAALGKVLQRFLKMQNKRRTNARILKKTTRCASGLNGLLQFPTDGLFSL